MSTEIENNVAQFLRDASIKFEAQYAGEQTRDKWQCDAWRVKFSKWGGEFQTDFYTGLGHRKLPEGFKWGYQKGTRPGTIAHENNERLKKPVSPKAASVLYSLCLDSDAAHESFPDWCANYGYDDDSITASETYRKCCAIADDLRKVFSPDQVKALREMLQDY